MLIRIFLLTIINLVKCDYTELMNTEMSVRVEKLNVLYDNGNETLKIKPRCRLTLHKSGLERESCSSRQLDLNDTLAWSTRVCFKWICDTARHAIRVEDCWIGTRRNPLFVINDIGCSVEEAILTSPVYPAFNKATAIGWMSIRQKGLKYIDVGCNIRICDLCDRNCQQITPPRNCKKSLKVDYDAMWSRSSRVKSICYENVRRKDKKDINKHKLSTGLSNISPRGYSYYLSLIVGLYLRQSEFIAVTGKGAGLIIIDFVVFFWFCSLFSIKCSSVALILFTSLCQ